MRLKQNYYTDDDKIGLKNNDSVMIIALMFNPILHRLLIDQRNQH